MAVNLLGICGSTRDGSRTKILVNAVMQPAIDAGAETRVLDDRSAGFAGHHA
jgi:NAD(P)H-dependent FMN reductase